MKERMPIWFQALAIAVLFGVHIAAILLTAQTDAARIRVLADITAHDTLFLIVPLAILFLGVRFVFRFASVMKKQENLGDLNVADIAVISYSVVIVASVAASLAIGYWSLAAFLPTQKIREASYAAKSSAYPRHRSDNPDFASR